MADLEAAKRDESAARDVLMRATDKRLEMERAEARAANTIDAECDAIASAAVDLKSYCANAKDKMDRKDMSAAVGILRRVQTSYRKLKVLVNDRG